MAFPTTSVLDSFTRADENPLSGSGQWTNKTRSNNQDVLQLLSNQVTNNGATFAASAWWNVAQFSPPMEVFCTIAATGSDIGVDYMIKSPGGTVPDFYRFQTGSSNTILQLYRVTDGAFTAIGNGGSGWSQASSAGDSIGVYLESTTLHTFYYKPSAGSWTVVGTSTDSTFTAGTGYIGLGCGNNTSLRIDDFGGGAFVAAAETQSFYVARRRSVSR